MVFLSSVSSAKPRFGMIELLLPANADRPVPNVPRDDWGIMQARAIEGLFAQFAEQDAFRPTSMSQLMTFPGFDIPVYGHPYSSPRGDHDFEPEDIPYAVTGRVVSRGNAYRVWIDETQLPYNSLLQVLNFFVRASEKMTGKPMQYKVTDTELQPLYEMALVLLGRKVFPDNPELRPVATDNTSPPETA